LEQENAGDTRRKDVARNAGWTIITALLKGGAAELGLSLSETVVLQQICRPCNNGHKTSFPSELTIARDSCITERSVKRIKKRLKDKYIQPGVRLLTWETEYAPPVNTDRGKPIKSIYNLLPLFEWAKDYHRRYEKRLSRARGHSVQQGDTESPL